MNCVQLVGRLAKDPKQGNGVVSITVAVDRPTQEKATDFPQVKVFGKQAETVMRYLRKGSQVAVIGSIETGKYDRNGETVYFTDVIAHRVEFVSGGAKQAETDEKRASNAPEQIDGFEAIDEDVPF